MSFAFELDTYKNVSGQLLNYPVKYKPIHQDRGCIN